MTNSLHTTKTARFRDLLLPMKEDFWLEKEFQVRDEFKRRCVCECCFVTFFSPVTKRYSWICSLIGNIILNYEEGLKMSGCIICIK